MNTPASWRIVHSEASLGWGGQEHRVLAELQGFRRRGAWVALLAPASSQVFQRAANAGVAAAPLDTRKWRYPFTALRLKRWLRENRVQIVNTHSSRDGYLVALAARLARVPLLIRSRHIDVTYPNQWLSRHAFTTCADHVLTTSRKIEQHLKETFGLPDERVSTVPTGIDVEVFSPAGPRAQPGSASSPEEQRLPAVGMVSVLRSWKGHPIFLEAARLLVERGVKARFLIVGEGPQQENIRGKIAELRLGDAVTLAGHREDVPAVLRALTVLAIPSTGHEGIPQIGLQALACGTAVVGSDAGGIPEIIRDGETGRIVPAGDTARLADAIAGLLADEPARRRFTAAGRRLVEEHHSLDHMLDRLSAIYARHLSGPAAAAVR